MNERIDWIDIAKCFGIYAIYLGHFKELAGLSYEFVFQYHVALFFLISGICENFNYENNIKNFFNRKVRNILIPYVFFSMISVVILCSIYNTSLQLLFEQIVLILKGCIRNNFFAYQLWFLTCLFMIEVLFFFIKKIKVKWIIFLISLFCYIIANTIINPITNPKFWYNIDSALYYIIFFTIGYIAFPYISRLFETKNKMHNTIICITGIISFCYSILLYFHIDILNIIPFISSIRLFVPIIRALIVIWLFFILSRFIIKNRCLKSIGRNTLYLCGSEWIIKSLASLTLYMFGLKINNFNTIIIHIYTVLLLVITNKYIVPIEKRIITNIQEIFDNKMEK